MLIYRWKRNGMTHWQYEESNFQGEEHFAIWAEMAIKDKLYDFVELVNVQVNKKFPSENNV